MLFFYLGHIQFDFIFVTFVAFLLFFGATLKYNGSTKGSGRDEAIFGGASMIKTAKQLKDLIRNLSKNR